MAPAAVVACPQIGTVAGLGDARDRGKNTPIPERIRIILAPLILAQKRNLRLRGWSVVLTGGPDRSVGSAHVRCRHLGEEHLHVAGGHASLGETLRKHLVGSTIADV